MNRRQIIAQHPRGIPPAAPGINKPKQTLVPSSKESEPRYFFSDKKHKATHPCLIHQDREFSGCGGGYLNPNLEDSLSLDNLSGDERNLAAHLRRWGFHSLSSAGKLNDQTDQIVRAVSELSFLFVYRPEEKLWYPKALDIIGKGIYTNPKPSISSADAATNFTKFMQSYTPERLSKLPLS